MNNNLVAQLLEHPSPHRVWREVDERLRKEAADRKAFREWLKPDIKAEFINGEIIMHSPAKRRHNQATKFTAYLLESLVSPRNLGEVAIEKALVGLERNDVEPDVCFWLQSTTDTFTDDMDVYPAPDLVAEVLSKSTEKRDRGVKKEAYENDGVREYWIIDTKTQTLEQYRLTERSGLPQLELHQTYSIRDDFTSFVLPTFTIPVRAIFDSATKDETALRLILGN